MSALSQYNQLAGQFGNVVDGLEAHRDSAYNLAFQEYENNLNEALMKGQTFIQIGESTAGLYKGARSIKQVYDNHRARVRKIRENQGEPPDEEETSTLTQSESLTAEPVSSAEPSAVDATLAERTAEAEPTDATLARLSAESEATAEPTAEATAEPTAEDSDFASRFLTPGVKEEGEEDLFTKGLTSEDKQNLIRANLDNPEAPEALDPTASEQFRDISGIRGVRERIAVTRRNLQLSKNTREAAERQAAGSEELEPDIPEAEPQATAQPTQEEPSPFSEPPNRPPPPPPAEQEFPTEAEPLTTEPPSRPAPRLGQPPSDEIEPAPTTEEPVPSSSLTNPLLEDAPTLPESGLPDFSLPSLPSLQTVKTGLVEGAENLGSRAVTTAAAGIGEEASSAFMGIAGATAEAIPIVAGVAGLIGGIIELATPHSKPKAQPIFSATSQSEFVAPHFDSVMDAPSMSSAF